MRDHGSTGDGARPATVEPVDLPGLTEELLALTQDGRRFLLGVAGVPGAGKTTFVEGLAELLERREPGCWAHVPMDGFHLARSVIASDDRAARRGAPDTFDPAGYAHLLGCLRRRDEQVVYAPEFDRRVGDPVAGAIPVPQQARIVLTEGNYLLLPEPEWRETRDQLDAVWFLEAPDEQIRVDRLIDRHRRFGKDADHASRHVHEVDEANAALVARFAGAADRRLRWASW